MNATAFYPGSFDPVTLGHVDIVERAARLFSDLIVGVYEEPSKQVLFTAKEREEMFASAVRHLGNVSILRYQGLTVGQAKRLGTAVIVRGLRIGSDFEHEREMALMNRDIDASIDTICLLSSLRNQFVSSSRVKEIVGLGGDVSRLVPANVLPLLAKKIMAR